MRKLQTTQLLKVAGSYGIAATVTADAWLLFLDNAGVLEIPAGWYFNVPLAAMGLAGLPVTINLAQRLLETAYKQPGKITPLVTEAYGPGRAISFTKNGRPGTLMAQAVKSIFGEPAPAPAAVKWVSWQVPLESGDWVLVGERELQRFLELCDRRPKHKFSRRYWTQKRRPAMPLKKYKGLMTLLSSAGLIEARQHGASGWLINGLKPHHAVSYLIHESAFRI